MPRKLKLKAGAGISALTELYEGYEVNKNSITANVSVDKIEAVMRHFIMMHEEPLFFILELPANARDETETALGIVRALHKDVYYMDGCSQDEALTVMMRVGNLLFHDGVSSFGYGGHESGDEIMFGKYNMLTIYSRDISQYADFFCVHEIEKADHLITAWDVISKEHPGISERYEVDGKTVYDIPEQFKDWGMYLAEQREE